MLKNLHVTALGLSLVAVAASSAAGCLGSASDENASDEQNAALTDNCASATAWKAGIAVTAGSFVSYQGRLYKVLTSHTTQADWPPNAVPALFQDVGSCTGTGTSTSTSGAGGSTSTSTSSATTSTTTGAGGGGGAGGGSTGAGLPSGKLFAGYYQTWSDSWKANGADTVLAKLPSYVNIVNLSFMAPDTTYVAGSLNLSGTTHLDVPYDGPTLKAAIAALHQRNPNTRVMISVGGATLYNWAGFQPSHVADFVKDFGVDGVDLDYEPAAANCSASGGHVSCPSDAEFVSVVKKMRAALPRPKILSIAAWSVGAYGEGAWASAPPASAYTGIALAVLKDAQASAALDLLQVMSYDASPAFNPIDALKAYKNYFKGAVVMGVEVPPEAWGGHVYTIPEIDSLADAVKQNNGAGMMLWSIQKAGPAQSFSTEICNKFALGNCSAPLF